MIDLEARIENETNKVLRLTIDAGTHPDDIDFLTKLMNLFVRGGIVVIDPGTATEFVYESPGPIEPS
jgi:hypothetical protein